MSKRPICKKLAIGPSRTEGNKVLRNSEIWILRNPKNRFPKSREKPIGTPATKNLAYKKKKSSDASLLMCDCVHRPSDRHLKAPPCISARSCGRAACVRSRSRHFNTALFDQGAGRSSTSSKATTVLHSTYIYLSIPLTMPKGNFERGSHVLAVLLKFVKSTALTVLVV